MPIISDFPDGGGNGGGGIVVGNVSGIDVIEASESVFIRWTDPEDVTTDSGVPIATWGGTLLVRKAGSAPVSKRDGVVVFDNKTRNEYKEYYFCDSEVVNGITYYYKFFPYTVAEAYTNNAANEFTATPTVQVTGIDSWTVTNMSASTEAGDGKIAIKWKDPTYSIEYDTGYDMLTLAIWNSTTVVVKAGGYAISKDDADAVYKQKVITHDQYVNTPLVVSGLVNDEAYYISFFPETADGGVCNSTLQRVMGVANKITISAMPTQSGTLTYNGNAQSPTWSNYDTAKMTLGGTTTGVNAGSYNAAFTPTADYRWSDGSTTAKTVAWSIGKAAGSLTLSTDSVTLNSSATSAAVIVTRVGDGAITATSSDVSVATATVNGTTVTVSSVNDTTGEATITVKVAESNNYKAPADKTVSVTAQFLPITVGTPLNDCSWEDISVVSAAGKAANYWVVGDRKQIIINGTVGTLALANYSTCVYIIGFNHNGATNTIDFGTFKTLSGGTDICLIDSKYNSDASDGNKYFTMNHWGDSKVFNYGGWKGTDIRYDILGSTDVAPIGYGGAAASNREGYDATATCATNPVASTLMAALPADLRAVMKPMTIYTDNKGGGNNTASNVTTSIDYLPLLAEYEIFGARTNANSTEQNYQKQYAYYSAGNSKVKYRHSATTSTARWWERSPNFGGKLYFCSAGTNGTSHYNIAFNAIGLAPAFRV